MLFMGADASGQPPPAVVRGPGTMRDSGPLPAAPADARAPSGDDRYGRPRRRSVLALRAARGVPSSKTIQDHPEPYFALARAALETQTYRSPKASGRLGIAADRAAAVPEPHA